jgi:hypothetical protein
MSLFRIEAAKHAQRSNTAYAEGVKAFVTMKFYEAALEVARKFAMTYHIIAFTIIYFIVLILDTVFSSSLIRPLAESLFQTRARWAFWVSGGIYAGIIFALTWNSAKNFFQARRKNIEYNCDLEAIKNPDKPPLVIRNEVINDAKGKRRQGVLWGGLLFLIVFGLGIYRNYLVNSHTWFTFDSPDDLLSIVIPLAIAVCLIYLGQYKLHVMNLWEYNRRLKEWTQKVQRLQQIVVEEGQMCMDFTLKADNVGEPSLGDKETQTCLERMRKTDVSSEDFFSNLRPRIFEVTIQKDGLQIKGVPLQACTTEGELLYDVTDKEGRVSFNWKSSKSHLVSLKIQGKQVPGVRFESGQHFSIDLSDLEGFGNTSSHMPATTSSKGDSLNSDKPYNTENSSSTM